MRRHHRRTNQPAGTHDGSHNRASVELDSNVPRTPLHNSSCNLHRAGKDVENCVAACQSNSKPGPPTGNLIEVQKAVVESEEARLTYLATLISHSLPQVFGFTRHRYGDVLYGSRT